MIAKPEGDSFSFVEEEFGQVLSCFFSFVEDHVLVAIEDGEVNGDLIFFDEAYPEEALRGGGREVEGVFYHAHGEDLDGVDSF